MQVALTVEHNVGRSVQSEVHRERGLDQTNVSQNSLREHRGREGEREGEKEGQRTRDDEPLAAPSSSRLCSSVRSADLRCLPRDSIPWAR